MLCQECQKNQATLHFTKIINGQKTEIHICEHCAKEKGDYVPGSNSFSIHQLLSGLLNFEQPMANNTDTTQAPPNQLACEKCGMTYEEFARAGRFGCASCYHTFDHKLDPIFKRVHSGNVHHSGKIPKRIGGSIQIRRKIDELRGKLQQLITQEEFEQAAEVRDEIRSLESKVDEQGKGGV